MSVEHKAGIKEQWFTLARRKYHYSVGNSGGYAWTCQECGYYPSQSTLPSCECLNCGKKLKTTSDDENAQEVIVETTTYGYKFIGLGKP